MSRQAWSWLAVLRPRIRPGCTTIVFQELKGADGETVSQHKLLHQAG
jgi:hypothetical protein